MSDLAKLTRPQLVARTATLVRAMSDLDLQSAMTRGPAYECYDAMEREYQALRAEIRERDRIERGDDLTTECARLLIGPWRERAKRLAP